MVDSAMKSSSEFSDNGGGVANRNDFLTELPDDILLLILNNLPADDAVVTTLISRRWKDLWKLISDVDFSYRWVRVRGKEIRPSVSQFLRLHRAPSIRRFSVSLRCRRSMVWDVQSWMAVAARKNVEHLYVSLSDGDDNRKTYMSQHFCFSSTPVLSFPAMATLTLKSVQLVMKCFPRCESLRELHLEDMKLTEGREIWVITEKSPALQLIRLVNCNARCRYLYVSVHPDSDLGTLIIESEFTKGFKNLRIIITAPKIRRIEFFPCMPNNYYIDRIGAGIEARFDVDKMFQKGGAGKANCDGLRDRRVEGNFFYLLQKFHSAKVLELCSWCIQMPIRPSSSGQELGQALGRPGFSPDRYLHCLSVLEVRHQVKVEFEATHLVLNTGLHQWELPGIALLLKTCPKLENLVIVLNDRVKQLEFDSAFLRCYAFEEKDFWEKKHASLYHLQKLAVVEFRRENDEGIRELETWKSESIEKQFFSQDTIMGYTAGAELLKFLKSKSVNLAKLIFTTKKKQFQICLKEA